MLSNINTCLLIDRLIVAWLAKDNNPDTVTERIEARIALENAINELKKQNEVIK